MDRAQVQFVDLVLGLFVLIALVVLFPVYDQFAQSISTAAGPLTTLILRLIYPALIIGLVLSVGVSARRSGGIT